MGDEYALGQPQTVTNYLALLDPDCRATVEVVDAARANAPVGQRKVAFCVRGELAHRIVCDQQSISSVVIDLDTLCVTKYVELFSEFDVVSRELGWLRALLESGISPPLVATTSHSITTEYVGEPVRAYNLPSDWRRQADRILEGLAGAGCSHNDIKCDNLMVLNGRITLIDFGWSTSIGSAIPRNWPEGIGRQHRLDVHKFDDRRAIFTALESAARGTIDKSVVMKPSRPAR